MEKTHPVTGNTTQQQAQQLLREYIKNRDNSKRILTEKECFEGLDRLGLLSGEGKEQLKIMRDAR